MKVIFRLNANNQYLAFFLKNGELTQYSGSQENSCSAGFFQRTLHLALMQVQCGGERIRTDDLLRARQLLSQLSYTPSAGFILFLGLSGIEPPTLRLSVVRSNHLSYRPNDDSAHFFCGL